ncbi:MAG: nucleotidyltransferase family protein [Gammaproteobacteria bacterium]|jgi:molybdenum cofactor cytidylyltransferase
MMSQAVGVLLAAGQSTRFGTHKLLQPLPDTQVPIALQAARHLCQALPDSVAVIRNNDPQLHELLLQTGIDVVINDDADNGMSTSIACGIHASPHASSWILALSDMPYIASTTINRVSQALQEGALIAAPTYKDRRGHPVGFSHQLKHELLRLRGDRGAKAVVERHRDELVLIDVNDDGVLRDIDRPEDITSR